MVYFIEKDCSPHVMVNNNNSCQQMLLVVFIISNLFISNIYHADDRIYLVAFHTISLPVIKL